MVDCCVKFDEKIYHDICSSNHFKEFRYVIFNINVKDSYLPSRDKPPKMVDIINISSSEFSLLPRRKQLSRITIEMTATQPTKSINSIGSSFELVAIKPMSDKVFVDACTSFQIDLITFNYSEQLSFRFHVPTLRTAMNRGLFFEIDLSPLLEQSDQKQKQSFILNATDLITATKGKSIILSSGATTINGFKGTKDLIAMGIMLGLTTSQAYDAVYVNPMKCITRSRRRFPINAMIAIE
ncbi:ribonuclease P protein subunit p30, putative [Entamoeba dispar SAW760]|uniref:Ribonuclease P protein subunit p30, putative n=1 Tax=Entamoeba dispar (strain ATCC PRA-260 / SAW760) TaxID=370354 RepID=B0E969_ENTDS|nr:ribonuclease P protein subunit p30, putative [Entamoeba dispar SAW760]EDR28898.1 ribonuclease P protein subunit p30, putative [Entamoeba dispar SAW760]|eukprot:EDR28898.1 ribonuclease P protein subunit p30, putative [Entamoeba dispar SAW760]